MKPERKPENVVRTLAGTWPRMILFGSIEDVGTAYLHQRLRMSPNSVVRRLAPLAPIVLTALHIVAGSHNLMLSTNDCTNSFGPGYVDNGTVCYLPSSASGSGHRLAARMAVQIRVR
ncbi:MAG: hypothetical protein WB987_18690 [Candidatus Acidiferrales bacterium]